MLDKIEHHSKLIKLIKYFFISTAFLTALLIGYFIFINQDNKIRQNTTAKTTAKNSEQDIGFKVNLPDLVGTNLDNGPYHIIAKEMQELSGHISFVSPEVKLMLKHLNWLSITAKEAELTPDEKHLQLFGDLRANFDKIYYFKGSQAEIFAKNSIIQSNHYSKLYTEVYDLESDAGFILNYQKQTASFHGKINANINKDGSTTNIKSDKLDVLGETKTGHFLGNVKIGRAHV